MKAGTIALIVVALAGVFGVMKFVGVRNDLAVQNEGIAAAWSQVEVQLQRRADLVPNLVATVKGFAAQEKGVFESIANARAALGGARTTQQKIDAHSELGTALSRLLVVVEAYPMLKSDQNFLDLQRELAGTENRILVERRKYNEVVQKYNTTLALFPNNIVASLSGFQRNDAYFKTDPTARDAPKIDFTK